MLNRLKVYLLYLVLVVAQDCPRTTFKNSNVKINDVAIRVTGCITAQKLQTSNIDYDQNKTNAIYIEGVRLANINQGSVANFQGRLSISFGNSIINGIKSKAFVNLPGVFFITIRNCGVSTIESDAFEDLPALDGVSLKYNHIRTLPPNTFNNLPLLKSVNLENNRLELFKADWFKNTPKLTRLSLSHNLIHTILTGTFDGLPGLEQIDLKGNRIQRLDQGAFCGLPNLMYFDLSGNNLTFVSENSLQDIQESLIRLSLYGNPIQCPCYEKLMQWSYDSNIEDPFRNTKPDCFGENAVCISAENGTTTECVENDDEKFAQELNLRFDEQFKNRHCFLYV